MEITKVVVHTLSVLLASGVYASTTPNNTSTLTRYTTPELNCVDNGNTGCSCEMNDGSGVVDLTSIGNTNNEPRFKDYTAPDGAKYSYNPCFGFTEGKCVNSAVCMTHGKSMLSIGEANKVAFQYEPDLKRVVTAYFTHQTIVLAAEVELICDPDACEPTFDPQGVQEMGLYLFTMTTVCACPGMCTSSGAISCKSASGIFREVGTILCISILVLFTLYLICGVLYNKIRNKASGGDLIPNKEFWASFPGLVKDGFFFTFGRCLPSGNKYQRAPVIN